MTSRLRQPRGIVTMTESTLNGSYMEVINVMGLGFVVSMVRDIIFMLSLMRFLLREG